MAIDDRIRAFISRVAKVTDAARRERIVLYANGLASRFQHAHYSLEQLAALTGKAPGPSGPFGRSDVDRVHFYSDTFWAFERSVLDVLAQLINQTEAVGLNERDCDFAGLIARLRQHSPGSPLTRELEVVAAHQAYSELNDYRNCSLHRRQVYVEVHEVQKVYVTPGYGTSTGSVTSFEWYVCDNPLDTAPTVNSKRPLFTYCQDVFSSIEAPISKMLDMLLP